MGAKLVIVKVGFLGTTPLAEALIDERGIRKDVSVRAVSTGCRMGEDDALEVVEKALAFSPDLIIFIAPSITQPGPKAALKLLQEKRVPTLIVSDRASKKAVEDYKEMGYIIVEGDPMIGARREFLDPIEMAVFNSDIIRVLSITGVLRLLHVEIDRLIERIKQKGQLQLPKIVVDAETALRYAGISNPYAKAKLIASYRMAQAVAALSVEGCYVKKEREEYLPTVAAAHELLRRAAVLADEAREMEKAEDSIERRVHFDDGSVHTKLKFFDGLK
ncbi:MAG: F420-dependent methylenetetrahydromethanopterin dehydrogenase [Nitrososphaerota archaeon]